MRKDFFNQAAQNWKMPEAHKIELIKTNILPLLELKQGESLLDACSGTGALLSLLKEFNLEITEFDFSPKMIEKAKETYPQLAEFVVGDVENMPFKDSAFNKVICHNSFPHIDNKQKAFYEVFRVLKPGGIFLISHDGSKKMIDEHHKHCHHAVSGDMLPSNKETTLFAAVAGFSSIEILDEDKYFAVVCRK